jgi:hypothetical protein
MSYSYVVLLCRMITESSIVSSIIRFLGLYIAALICGYFHPAVSEVYEACCILSLSLLLPPRVVYINKY